MRLSKLFPICGLFLATVLDCTAHGATPAEEVLKKINVSKGIVAILGLPDGDPGFVVSVAKSSELTIYFQSGDEYEVTSVRRAAEESELLGTRIFVDGGTLESIPLADNVTDGIWVSQEHAQSTSEAELLRVLRPRATAFFGQRELVKPVPNGIDEWTHPYHGPDNNPQSTDQYVRGNFNTQFLAIPKFSPMPEQSVAAGGRIYKAMGHIAHKENQNKWLNQLLCINAYNGTILWQRPLPEGFMIHRNTMVATEDALLMGDHESCKVFDGRTGEIREQITIPEELTDGPVWKWMGTRDGVLYALVGNPEIQVDTQRSARRGLGHWPWGMWKGHDYENPHLSFGFGRTLVAVDLKTKKLLWHYRDKEFLDARAVCMNDSQIFFYCPEKQLGAVDLNNGKLLWKNSDDELLEAIGPNGKAQHYITGYATTCYMKCNSDYVFFAGPNRERMVVASSKDGSFAWSNPTGNLQLVLREDGIYAAGPQNTQGMKFDYATGSILSEFPARRACTRATGCVDSIFFRATGGTVRLMTETDSAQHIAPMRPPCQDGVIISNGHLYWGPWMCGCQLSLYGNICLAPAEPVATTAEELFKDALVTFENIDQVAPLNIQPGDWPYYRGGNSRNDVTSVSIPSGAKLKWTSDLSANVLPTAPVVAGNRIFIADRSGVVRCLDENGQSLWKAYTSGPVYYSPAIANDRLYVGSADGRVYAYEATSGRLLWTFRVGPKDRRIPVYGQIISRWPVSGGVVVENDTVYAAAGIAHYDGTYVVALDSVTGELKAHNSTSGVLSEEVNSGVSMQGNLMISNGELQFLGGGVYELARYDLKTLECLNTPKAAVTSQFRTAFYPYYPEYGKYVSLDHTCGDGATLCHDASYEGSLFTNLALETPLPPGVPKTKKEIARWARRGKNADLPKKIWQDKSDRRFTSFVVSENQILATGHPDLSPDKPFLAAINIKDGTDAWIQELPADAVKGGTALDHQGRIYISLENGQLLCFDHEQ